MGNLKFTTSCQDAHSDVPRPWYYVDVEFDIESPEDFTPPEYFMGDFNFDLHELVKKHFSKEFNFGDATEIRVTAKIRGASGPIRDAEPEPELTDAESRGRTDGNA